MDNKYRMFVWGDNWSIEDNDAWFVDGERNTLCHLDIKTNQCDAMIEIPDTCINKFRLNPRCMKIGNKIFCMPDTGKYIWIYHLDSLLFQSIEIFNPNFVRLSIVGFWVYGDKIYALSKGLKAIVEIDIEAEKISNYYVLTDIENEIIAGAVKVKNVIYCVSSVSNKIFLFDLNSKYVEIRVLSEINGGLHTICFDGDKFWLSGYKKEIYIWKKENNWIKRIVNFPMDFGIYDYKKKILDCKTEVYDTPAFIDSGFAGNRIWFVPFRTNLIVYFDKNAFDIHILKIENEQETEYSLSINNMAHKYLLIYILNKQYIGLYSFKNKNVLEIDSINLRIKSKNYMFSSLCLYNILKSKVFFEENIIDREIYQQILLKEKEKINLQLESIGMKIYNRTSSIY